MAKSGTSQRDEHHAVTRRALIKWSVAAGAALGVSRSKIFDILERTAGKRVAFAASDHATTRSVHLAAGHGGLAWFQLFWPQVDIARAHNPSFAWHKLGQEVDVPGTARPLVIGPDTPWANLPAERQVTCFTCGYNETHVTNAQSTTTLNGSSIFAIASLLQASTNAVIPFVTLGGAAGGAAPGADPAANVADADGLIALFTGAAASAGGILSNPADAQVYKMQFDALTQLNRAANRTTQTQAYATASGAARLLGTNLAARLSITGDDLARYGITGDTRAGVVAIARAMIITVKAFQMGLMNAIVMPAMLDDPHTAFAGDVDVVPPQLKLVFDAFMADLAATTDDATGVALADDTVITIHGDTPKDALTAAGWPDGTRQNTNHVYLYTAGHAKPGWFGSLDRTGAVTGFGADGKPAPYNPATTAKLATATIAYCIAKRDAKAIANFANGLMIGGVFANPKDG
jgi:hypothetical protein